MTAGSGEGGGAGATGAGATGVGATGAGATGAGTGAAIVGTGAGGTVYGQRIHIRDLALEGKQVTGLTAVVIDGLTISLLGQGYLRTLDAVEIKGDTMILR